MQIGIRLHDIRKGTLDERLALAHEQGFKCGHLALTKMLDDYQGPIQLTPGFAMQLKKTFDKHELDIAVLGCYLNLANPNPDKLKQIQETYYANIRFNSFLGAGVVGTETGCPNEEYKLDDNTHTEEALLRFIEGLRPVVRCAEHYGVNLAIEPVANHIVNTPVRARKVLDSINSSNLRIILDPVNLLDIHNYENRDAIIKEAIELLKNEIDVIHIKDFKVNGDHLESIACGTGMMNYEEVCRFIKHNKNGIHVTLENTNSDNAVSAREHLQKIYDTID